MISVALIATRLPVQLHLYHVAPMSFLKLLLDIKKKKKKACSFMFHPHVEMLDFVFVVCTFSSGDGSKDPPWMGLILDSKSDI